MNPQPRPTDERHLEERLARALDTWRGWSVPLSSRPRITGPIGAGLTNSNWLVDTDRGAAVVRLNCPIGQRLGVDRRREARVLKCLEPLGITPPLWHNHPREDGFLVTGYLPGRVWRAEDMADHGQRRRLVALVDRYQQVDTGLPPRDYVAYLGDYWRNLAGGMGISPGLANRFHHCRDALGRLSRAVPAVLTHHDLTPGNILDCDGRLYLIDWEYAAPGWGELDRLAVEPESSPALARQLAALMDELWLLLRQLPCEDAL